MDSSPLLLLILLPPSSSSSSSSPLCPASCRTRRSSSAAAGRTSWPPRGPAVQTATASGTERRYRPRRLRPRRPRTPPAGAARPAPERRRGTPSWASPGCPLTGGERERERDEGISGVFQSWCLQANISFQKQTINVRTTNEKQFNTSVNSPNYPRTEMKTSSI